MLNELPATIYIGLGAIVAAIITALITFVNLITTKDQNISDHRQSWINSIREDISRFIGLSSHMTGVSSQFSEVKNESDEEAILLKELYSNTSELCELFNRIILRLNPDENQKIINALKAIEKVFSGDSEKRPSDILNMASLTSDLRNSSQEMLQQEWKRVKRGELSYLITKWSFIIVIASSTGFGVYKLNDHKEIESSVTTQPAVEKLPNK